MISGTLTPFGEEVASRINSLYLRDEDAIVYYIQPKTDENHPFTHTIFINSNLPVEELDKLGMVDLPSIPPIKLFPSETNTYLVGSVYWLLQEFVSALGRALKTHNLFDPNKVPRIVLSQRGRVTLIVDHSFEDYTFGSLNLLDFLKASFPDSLQGFVKDACIQEPKYLLSENSFKGELKRKSFLIIDQTIDTGFIKSLLLGDFIGEFEKQFSNILTKFTKKYE